MEQFEGIRREHRVDGASIRELAQRHKVHRRTVRAALADAVPPTRKPPTRGSPVLGRYEATVRVRLTKDLDAPRKQRHTARRVWQRLLEEEGAVVAESSVRALVAKLKVEVGLVRRSVSVPQTHLSAAEAEGRLRGVQCGHRRDGDEVMDVLPASVALGQSGPHRLRQPGAGVVPGRPGTTTSSPR